MTVFEEDVGKFLEVDPPSRCAAPARHVLVFPTFHVSGDAIRLRSETTPRQDGNITEYVSGVHRGRPRKRKTVVNKM